MTNNILRSLYAVSFASIAIACAAPQGDEEVENVGEATESVTRLAAPAPAPVPVKCQTITGTHDVTQKQCETLLSAQGCKPGAVVGGTQKCSTADEEAKTNPGDFTSAPPDADGALVTCVTHTGEHRVTEEQCKKLLEIQGCTPGAIVGGKQKCSSAG